MRFRCLLLAVCSLLSLAGAGAQNIIETDTLIEVTDSVVSDSDIIADMAGQIADAHQREIALNLEIEQLRQQLQSADSLRREAFRSRIDSLRAVTTPAWVVVGEDSLFRIYAKHGGMSAQERATRAGQEINQVGKLFGLTPDSVYISANEFETDLIYGDYTLVTLTDIDGIWAGESREDLAESVRMIIVDELRQLKQAHSLWVLARSIGSLLLIILGLVVAVRLINVGYHRLLKLIDRLAETKLKPIYLQKLEILDIHRQLVILRWVAKAIRFVMALVVILLAIPLIFSVFPPTEKIAKSIIMYIWHPCRDILVSVIEYIPNLFTICIICVAIRLLVKVFRYVAEQLSQERLHINGFFADWAMPTFYIVRFLLYAFGIAMIYPYLPGSNSGVFQGISVFIGLIVSIGSSGAIGNVIAGLVITYMRPFKIGDRIELQNVSGDVIEKTPFVTRIRTVKNEIVTVPNSFIMTTQTVNLSQSAKDYGLIIHCDVNVSYTYHWRRIYHLPIEAALDTRGVVDDPRPFVLQTTLGNDYGIYQINAYIKDANLLPDVYSDLNVSIQNVFNREGIEILSPHYISTRDGSPSTLCNEPDPGAAQDTPRTKETVKVQETVLT